MTDTRKDDNRIISRPEQVIPLYAGNGLEADKQTMGFETEIALYGRDKAGKPRLASATECSRLIEDLQARGEKPQLEMSSAIELASSAYPVTRVTHLTAEINNSHARYLDAINRHGLHPSQGALQSFATLVDAEQNLVDRDRARGLVRGMKQFKAPEFLKVTLLCTSTQISLSYSNPDDLLDTLKTGYALIPAIYGIFANHPPTIEGNNQPYDGNPRARWYGAFGKDGGIPDSVLEAKDGNDFIRRHVEQVFNTEMLFHYDNNGNTIWPENPVTFSALAEKGLNTKSNYDLAETFVYTDIKVCNIRDAEGVPVGKRMEIRSFDAGQPGVTGAVPFIHATLRDPIAREQVKAQLAVYGLCPENPDFGARVKAARTAAAEHGGKHLDVPFGVKPDGTPGTLKEFAKDLGGILQLYAARNNPPVARHLADVMEICSTGVTMAAKRGTTEAPAPTINDNHPVRFFRAARPV